MPNQYKPGTVAILVRLPSELKTQLVELATKMDRSVNWIIRDAIKQYLAKKRR